MDRRAFVASVLSPVALAFGCAARVEPGAGAVQAAPTAEVGRSEGRLRALSAMKHAARFMIETVAYKGGYVWTYLPDFSRCWGELEARRSMTWLQPPGTPSMGHLFLDAFHATGDAFYLGAASDVASAVVSAQHWSGGWNYVYDIAGPESLREWYETVGRNGWRLEEFHIHPDSATFDDACTAVATQFLLRMQLERPTPELSLALDKAIRFVKGSQYPSGGWPQRYPLASDYTRLLTFNDDVLGENIRTLLMAYGALGQTDALDHLRAAMDSVLALQQASPQPGWALQHDFDGRPAAARSFEPAALATHTTATNIEQLLTFHALTGDAKYLARVPEALDWLDKIKLSPELAAQLGGTHPTFIQMGSDRPLYVHRRGSNVVNGKYYWDEQPGSRLSHYSPARTVNLEGLRERFLASTRSSQTGCPLLKTGGVVSLPRYFSLGEPTLVELCAGLSRTTPSVTDEQAMQLVEALDSQGRWLRPLEFSTNPYRGPGSAEAYLEDTYASTHVGDRTDTSPYRPAARPATYPAEASPLGISTRTFIENMGVLIAYVGPNP